MTPEEHLAGPLLKLNRAKFHIQNLNAVLEEFSRSSPYGVSADEDRKPGYKVLYVSRLDEIPKSVSVLLGDILHNLRAALDHLAQQFYFVGTGGSVQAAHVSYPIFEDAASYKSGVGGKVKGLRQDAIDFIDATNPYRGGNDVLWQIHKLNIIDKHRVLLAVQSASGPVGFDTFELIKRFADSGSKEPVSMQVSFTLAEPKCPLKIGDEVLFLPLDGNPKQKVALSTFVALHEPPITNAQPLSPFFANLANTVDGILNSARPLLT